MTDKAWLAAETLCDKWLIVGNNVNRFEFKFKSVGKSPVLQNYGGCNIELSYIWLLLMSLRPCGSVAQWTAHWTSRLTQWVKRFKGCGFESHQSRALYKETKVETVSDHEWVNLMELWNCRPLPEGSIHRNFRKHLQSSGKFEFGQWRLNGFSVSVALWRNGQRIGLLD